MADNRYGGYGRNEGWRQREGSIFSDEDDRWSRGSSERWSGGRGGSGGDDERGFFERAGDEVRSWFGDEEAERRRESDMRRDEGRGEQGWRSQYRSNEGGRDYGRGWDTGASRSSYGSSGSDRGRASSDWVGGGSSFMSGSSIDQGGYAQRSFGGRSGMAGRSQWDENYRRWRDQQISQFDREYDDYCRERQQQFEQDFDSWRSSRLTEGGSGQYGGASSSGETMQGSSGKSTSGGSRSRASETASATTTGGGGTGSAMESSTGSSGGSSGRGRSRT